MNNLKSSTMGEFGWITVLLNLVDGLYVEGKLWFVSRNQGFETMKTKLTNIRLYYTFLK